MTFRELVGGAIRGLRARQRRTWHGEDRVWIELRELVNGAFEQVVGELGRRLEAEDGIRWARFNGRYDRLVVCFDPTVIAADQVVRRVEALEEEVGHGSAPLGHDPRRHPADLEPSQRAVIELGVQAASLVAGLSLRMSAAKVRARHVDLAALTTALRGVPRLRGVIERQLGPRAAELTLEAADAVARALMQGSTGAAVDLVQHTLELRERRGRRRVWAEWEPWLSSDPDSHPRQRVGAEPRIRPVPDGAVERYVERAVLASLGAFGFGLAAAGDAEAATAPLFGGIPKPARIGRASFVRQVARRLGREGVLVQHAEALDLLDRVDVVMVDASIIRGRELRAVIDRARRVGLRTIAWGRGAGRLKVDQIVGADEVRRTVRRLQVEGRVVCVIAGGDCPGFSVADVGVGVVDRRSARPDAVPWCADLVCDLEAAPLALVIGAVPAAQIAARHAVGLAGAEAVVSMVMALGGVRRRALRHILEASNLASLAALIDSVRIVEGISADLPVPASGPPWHAMAPDDVIEALGTRRDGLQPDEVEERRPPPTPEPSEASRLGRALVEELRNPLTPVLAGGAGLSALVGSTADAGIVLSVIGLNGLVGGLQRYRTDRALDRFGQRERGPVRVIRGGQTLRVAAAEVVRGDIVALRAGDVVPADCRLLEADGLEVDEAGLTGESLPVCKSVEAVDAPVPDRTSMLHAGTTIAAGTSIAVVVATGDGTEVARALPGARRMRPPRGVEARLQSLTDLTLPVAATAGMAVMAAGVLRQRPPEELIGSAVGLAVASVPEGLPVLATMAQLAAARRLGERGALVRHPRAVEALGRIQVLCADKTGTMTEGRLRLGAVSDGERVRPLNDLDDTTRRALAAGLRASPTGHEGHAHLTDQAVVDGARRVDVDADVGVGGWERVEELPFAPSRSYSATVGRAGRRWVVSVKGSPEAVLARCADLHDERRAALTRHAEQLAARGWRVLAVAERVGGRRPKLDADQLGKLRLLGFVGLVDPVRDAAKEAVAKLRQAGVAVRLITGDHPGTACAVAQQLGLEGDAVVTGEAIDALDDAELAERVRDVCVFARVTPSHKVRIVGALQRAGWAVGMTGDGANDVPAIQLADVGIALGENATAAARDAADLVVVNGRIETLVDAVLEGRKLWVSVRDAVSVLVGGNLGEIGFTVVGGLATGHAPLNTRQLLLVNLLTDAVPAMAIAMMPPSSLEPERLLQEGPERSLDERLTRDILWRALITGGSASAAWLSSRATGSRKGADTVGLVSIVGTQLGQTLVVGRRSKLVTAASLGSIGLLLAVVQTPGVSRFFGCRPLGPLGLTQAATAAGLGTAASTLVPLAVRRWGPAARRFVERHELREREWVRIVAESRGASRMRHQVEQLRGLLRPRGEAPATAPFHRGEAAEAK